MRLANVCKPSGLELDCLERETSCKGVIGEREGRNTGQVVEYGTDFEVGFGGER